MKLTSIPFEFRLVGVKLIPGWWRFKGGIGIFMEICGFWTFETTKLTFWWGIFPWLEYYPTAVYFYFDEFWIFLFEAGISLIPYDLN